ncbi:MAG: amidohydrolase family protein [Chitinophagaceae bacterium]
MRTIDAHQHFWMYDSVRDSWIGENMEVLKRNFLPGDIAPVLTTNGVDGCVAVQANETETETSFLLDLAGKNDFIKGVVGWTDLEAPDLETKLSTYRGFSKLKGFRHMLQSEARRDSMLQPAFVNGIRLLQEYGFTYDLIILPDQLPFAIKLAEKFPEMRFVIDHLAKPAISSGETSAWETGLRKLSELKNVYCKISGLVTQANWHSWKKEDLYPCLDVAVETFGTDRLMYGSDWPVCLLAAEYSEVKGITDEYFSSFSEDERLGFYSLNAAEFYSIPSV